MGWTGYSLVGVGRPWLVWIGLYVGWLVLLCLGLTGYSLVGVGSLRLVWIG